MNGVDHCRSLIEMVKWQIVEEIRTHCYRKPFRTRREMRVHQLRAGMGIAESLNYGKRLKAFADGRRMHPEKRTRAVASRRCPFLITLDESAPRGQRFEEFRIACRCNGDCKTREGADSGVRSSNERMQMGALARHCGDFDAAFAIAESTTGSRSESGTAPAMIFPPTRKLGVD